MVFRKLEKFAKLYLVPKLSLGTVPGSSASKGYMQYRKPAMESGSRSFPWQRSQAEHGNERKG